MSHLALLSLHVTSGRQYLASECGHLGCGPRLQQVLMIADLARQGSPWPLQSTLNIGLLIVLKSAVMKTE